MPTERQLFERFFPRKVNPSRLSREILAFGIYHFFKWDRIREWEKKNTDDQNFNSKYFEIADSFGEAEIEEYERIAEKTLDSLKLKQRGFLNYVYGISQSIIGGFLLLIILAMLYVGLRTGFGLDLVRVIGINVEIVEETLPTPAEERPPGTGQAPQQEAD